MVAKLYWSVYATILTWSLASSVFPVSPKGFLRWTEWTETLLRNPLSPIILIGHQLRSETSNSIWMTCADTYDGQQICNAHRDLWPDSSDDISLRFTLTHPDGPNESCRTFICPLKNALSVGEVCEGTSKRCVDIIDMEMVKHRGCRGQGQTGTAKSRRFFYNTFYWGI